MKLSQLLAGISGIRIKGSQDIDVFGLTNYSQRVRHGDLFIACKGGKHNGHNFVEEAIARGAAAVVVDRNNGPLKGATIIETEKTQDVLGELCVRFYDNPAEKLKLIGVTGTNGKTTTAYLIHSIFQQAGLKMGLLGTIEYLLGERVIPASLTTPDILDIYQYLNQMVLAGCRYAVLEVSSHALHQGRVATLDFNAAVFTNLGRDHLDYHLTTDEYLMAKSKLFKHLALNNWAVVNFDDPYSKNILENTLAKVVGFGIRNKTSALVNESALYIRTRGIKQTENGTRFSVYAPGFKSSFIVNTKLIGLHNIYNILAAIGVALCNGIRPEDICAGINSFNGACGRLEQIKLGQPFKVFIDFAHTPDALENVLFTLRNITKGRIILVFGCGGDRDRDKRPLMGRLASQLANFTVLTNDNPRTENPVAIISDIEKGFVGNHYKTITERKEAIFEAIAMAQPSDTVLIAGKGHENYQIFSNTVVPFNDRDITMEVLTSNYASAIS